MVPNPRERRLLAHLKVDVDEFVGEGGELVGEASLVFPGHVGGEGVRVVLLLDLLVDLLALGIGEQDVDVVVASGYHLS